MDNTTKTAREITKIVLKYHPNCPYCNEKMMCDKQDVRPLTPTQTVDFVRLFEPEYIKTVQLAHLDCWQMANNEGTKQ